MKITNVTHSVYNAGNKNLSNNMENGEMITVELDYETDKCIIIKSVSLTNPYNDETDRVKKLTLKKGVIGATNIKNLNYLFEKDQIMLVDGAIFTIITKTSLKNDEVKSEYVLSNNESEWVKQ